MAVYFITWNFNKEKQNYDKVRKDFLAIVEKYEFNAESGLSTARWISTADSVSTVHGKVKHLFDGNDTLYIVKVTNDRIGNLTQKTWDWLSSKSV